MSDSDSDESDPGVQVRVSLKLAPSVQDRSLQVPSEPIAVPADIGRKGLTAVLNHLLGRNVSAEGEKEDESDVSDDDGDNEKLPPIPFEFILAKNRLLRKGVEKEARQYGISMEEAISITYFPATTAPDLLEDEEEVPDWISCLAIDEGTLVSGCYDGTVHVYRQDGETLDKLHSTSTSSGPIKALNIQQWEDGSLYIAAASIDQTLSIHSLSQCGLEFIGHCVQEEQSSGISSLDFCKSTAQRLLASGDGTGDIRLWDLSDSDQSETKKKQKTSSTSEKALGQQIKPLSTIEAAHSQTISGISWGNHSTDNVSHLITGSWDHSIKLWDIEKQDCLLTLNGSRVVSCMDTSYHTEGVVATGHPDCTIRLWDVRVQTTTQVVSDTTFRPSHKAWVSSVQWNPSNAFQLASTSYDGTVKLWDIRSSNPLHTVRAFGKEDKAMCLVWTPAKKDGKKNQSLFTGGSDCVIKLLSL